MEERADWKKCMSHLVQQCQQVIQLAVQVPNYCNLPRDGRGGVHDRGALTEYSHALTQQQVHVAGVESLLQEAREEGKEEVGWLGKECKGGKKS